MKTRRSVLKEPPLSPSTKRARRDVVNAIADLVIEKQCMSPTAGRAPTYGYVKNLLKTKQKVFPWLTRDMLYSKINRLKKKPQENATPRRNPLFSTDSTRPSMPGRPKGSTDKSALKKKNIRIAAINELCERMKKEKESSGIAARGCYSKTHQEVVAKFGLQDQSPIKYSLVQKRLKRGGITGQNIKSPVQDIEPVLLTIAAQRQEAGQPLKPCEGLALANALIEDTRIQQQLEAFQIAHYGESTGVLSKGYWRGFMRRHQHILSQKKGARLAACRQDWTTYENLEVMYELVYGQMVDAGVARELSPEEEYWVDDHGRQVECESKAAGFKVCHEITHPEWILFGDEVGTDIDQTDDGHIGGQTYLAFEDCTAAITSSTAGGRFTVIGFTAASGDPVMCLIVFAAEELTFMQRMGYDMCSDVHYDPTKKMTENCGPGRVFPGGPTCRFRGKDVPALLTMSPKGSISSDILRSAFERFDELGLYHREPGGPIPFALFDAHDSRLQLPFLNYINQKVNDRPMWKVCIGLPNGTALWQVGDSTQQNGCYKMAMYREKDRLVQYKQRMGLGPTLARHDIVPLVNRAWAVSFARKNGNVVAIRDRGWNPLDMRLLKLPSVKRTQVSNDSPVLNDNVDNEPLEAIIPSEIEVAGSTDEVSTITMSSLADLNFCNGISKDFSVDFLQYLVRKTEINENLKSRYKEGRDARGRLDAAKKLTGGTLFKSSHIVLDDEVLAIREAKENKKQVELERPIRNAISEYSKRRKAYQAIVDSNVPEVAYGKREYKAIVHFLKKNSDAAVPQNAGPIKQRYQEVRGRPVMTIPEYLADRGYSEDIVERVLSTFTNKEGVESIAEWM